MEPEITTPAACACTHEAHDGKACAAEGCNCGAEAAPAADAPAAE